MKINIFLKIFAFTLLNGLVSLNAFAQAPTIQWQKSLGGSSTDGANSILQTADGGFAFAGYCYSNDGDVVGNHGRFDYWIVKLNQQGTLQWQKSLGGSGDDEANSIQQTSDGGFIVAGYSDSNNGDVTGNHGEPDYWVVKLDSTGNMQWKKSLGGSLGDQANFVIQTVDGGYIVAGYVVSNNGDVMGNHGIQDYWLVKLNSLGAIQWKKTYGGTGTDMAASIQQTVDGGYIVAGESNSNNGDVSGNHGNADYWILKLDATGAIIWGKSFGGSSDDEARSVQITLDGGFVVIGGSSSNNGDVSGNHGNIDAWVLKLDAFGVIQWEKSLGGANEDMAYSIKQTIEGGYIIAGYSMSNDGDVNGNHGYHDYWIIKVDELGSFQWQKSLGGSLLDYSYSIQQTVDEGFIIAGLCSSDDGDVTGNHAASFDSWIVKLSPAPNSITTLPQTMMQIAPNPTDGVVAVEFKDANELQGAKISVLNMLGQTIHEESVILPMTFLNLSNQPNGLYLIKLQSKDGRELTQKIQKL